MGQSNIIKATSEATLFAPLAVAQNKTNQIDRKVIISFGEANSSLIVKLIKKIFKMLGCLQLVDRLDNRFYQNAIVIIKKHNFAIVKNEFQIKNAEKNPILIQLVPANILLLPETTQYKEIKKLHDDTSLIQEVASFKKAPTSRITIQKPQEHWLQHFTYDLQKDLEPLLEGDSSKIHQLNDLKKQNLWISDESFGLLVRDIIKETALKNVTDLQIQEIKNLIDFFNDHPFITNTLAKELQNNHFVAFDLFQTKGLEFVLYFESQEITLQANVLETINHVAKDYDQIKYLEFRKIDPASQREDFHIWLKSQNLFSADVTRLFTFFERLADKNIYSPKVIAEALQLRMKDQPVEKLMDDLFPRKAVNFDPLGWFGGAKTIIEADPADLFFKSEGKQNLLKLCFKLHAREIVAKEINDENFADQLTDLFKNSHLLLTQNSVSTASKLMAFAANLASKTSSQIVLKDLVAKKEYFNDFDLEKLSEMTPLQNIILKRITDTALKSVKSKDRDIASIISKNPTLLISTMVSTFIEKLFPANANKNAIQKALSTFAPLLNPIFAKPLLEKIMENNPHLSEEQKISMKEIMATLSNAMVVNQNIMINEVINGLLNTKLTTLDSALEFPKKVIKDQIVFKDSNEGSFFHSFVQTIVETNEIYRMAQETKSDLKTLPLPSTEKWLLLGLEDLCNGVPFIHSLTTMIPSFIVNTGGVTEYFAGKVVKSLTTSFLAGNQDLSSEEKDEMANAAEDLAKIILPMIPELKNKHNIQAYTQFMADLNSLVRSNTPITGEEVTAKFKGVADHFLDSELVQYYDPIYAAIQSIPAIKA